MLKSNLGCWSLTRQPTTCAASTISSTSPHGSQVIMWHVLEMSMWVVWLLLLFLLHLSTHLLSLPFSPPPAYFTELHGRSERSLQEALSPLGPLYSQNTRLYGDLYNDLRQYYRGSAVNLDETLSEFWSRLLERTFKTSVPTDVSEDTSSRGHFLNHSLVHRMIKRATLWMNTSLIVKL